MVTWVLAACGVLLVYQIGVIVAMSVVWRRTRTQPRRTPAALGLDYADVWIPTANGKRLHGWWIAGGEGRRPVAVLVHGWGRNTSGRRRTRACSTPGGIHRRRSTPATTAFRTPTATSLKKFSEDIRAVVDFLAARPTWRCGGLPSSVSRSAGAPPSMPRRTTRASAPWPRSGRSPTRRLDAAVGRGSWLLAPAMPLALRFVEWRVGVRLDDLAPERHAGRIAGRSC